MNTFLDMQAALESHLTPGIAIAWENVAYKPKHGTPFARVSLLPATPTNETIGIDGQDRHTGIFQVSLFYPVGEGRGNAVAKADEIITSYKRGTVLTSGTVTLEITKAWRSPAQIEPDWFHIPVNIQYLTTT